MQKQTFIILQDSQDSIEEIESIIRSVQDFSVIGTSSDGEKGLSLINELKPNFIIIGLILKSLDGFEVLEKLRQSNYNGKILVVSSFTNATVVSRAMGLGVSYYLAKPFSAEVLKKRIKEVIDSNYINNVVGVGFEKKATYLEERISKIFISVGIPPHIKGYQYLREGVKMAVNNPDIINNITKQLYPKIGEKYKTTASKVERAIRHAIEVAWNRGRIETINSMLGIRAYVGNEKPTNGEFIALIADKMILEGA